MWQAQKSGKACLLNFPLCPTVSGWACKNLFATCLLFPVYLWIACFPFQISGPAPLPTPSPLSKMAGKLQLSNASSGLISFGTTAGTSIINFNLSHVIWLLAWLEEFRRWEESYFFVSPQYYDLLRFELLTEASGVSPRVEQPVWLRHPFFFFF